MKIFKESNPELDNQSEIESSNDNAASSARVLTPNDGKAFYDTLKVIEKNSRALASIINQHDDIMAIKAVIADNYYDEDTGDFSDSYYNDIDSFFSGDGDADIIVYNTKTGKIIESSEGDLWDTVGNDKDPMDYYAITVNQGSFDATYVGGSCYGGQAGDCLFGPYTSDILDNMLEDIEPAVLIKLCGGLNNNDKPLIFNNNKKII